MLFTLLQAGYYAEPASGAAHYSAATMGMFVLIIVIGIAGYAVQARLQSVFRKYSKVQFPGGLTGAEVAEKMLRDNNIHNVKVTHVGGNLTDHFNPQTMTVNLSDSVYSSTSVAAAAVAAVGAARRHEFFAVERHRTVAALAGVQPDRGGINKITGCHVVPHLQKITKNERAAKARPYRFFYCLTVQRLRSRPMRSK